MTNKILTTFCLVFIHIAYGQTEPLPQIETVPGGLAIVSLNTTERPSAFYKNHRVMVIGKPHAWLAIIGIPLNAKPGTHKLNITDQERQSIHHFEVTDKAYKTQRITISDKRKVNPAPIDMERINKERPLIQTAKSSWTELKQVPLSLNLPVTGPYSSPFGLRRFFNDQPRNPHSGLDIAANLGTPIKAAATGRIVNTGDYFFNGKTVFIEHGQGFVTMYCHMDSISVNADQRVKQGETIGTVGKTGRVTGAHLHWGVYLNNTAVNPELFLNKN